jgi:hypothetical protein
VLQAEELGLGTCWIGWIKPKEVRKIISWPVAGARKTRLPAEEITTWL